MSKMMIMDGKGNGSKCHVGDDNKLRTSAVTRSRFSHAAESDEGGFVTNSGFVALTTTGSFNAMYYIKCVSDTHHIHIEQIRTCSTNTGHHQWKVIKNPTTGTIISDASAGLGSNSTFSSTNTIGKYATVYKASGDAKTLTNGEAIDNWTNKGEMHSTINVDGAYILKKGDSLGLECKPSTAGDACCHLFIFIEKVDHD